MKYLKTQGTEVLIQAIEKKFYKYSIVWGEACKMMVRLLVDQTFYFFKKEHKFFNCLRLNQSTLHFPCRNFNPDILTITDKPKINVKINNKMVGRDFFSFPLTD